MTTKRAEAFDLGQRFSRFSHPKLLQQPVDKRDLAQADADDKRPDEPFAQAQAALVVVADPETEFGRAGGDEVAIAQANGLNGHLVDGNNRPGVGRQGEALGPDQREFKVFVPDAIFLQLEIAARRASHPDRKTAGIPKNARLFAGKYL